MKTEICVALLPRIDNRCSCGYRLQAFHNREAFREFTERFHGMIYGEDVLLILSGGREQMVSVSDAREMSWIFETS